MESFIEVPKESGYGIVNLPFGVCQIGNGPSAERHVCVRVGDSVVDLNVLQTAGCFSGPILSQAPCFHKDTLNEFMGLGKPAWREARQTLTRILSSSEGLIRDDPSLRGRAILPVAEVAMCLPARIGDYTDFYTSKHHAFNCGCMFRDPKEALQPNWVHLPVGYHGRSSSVVVSGVDVTRPRGQLMPAGAEAPILGPSRAVDFELEMACVMGSGNELGTPIPVDKASDHIFGMVLMNDWSARDIQRWEMAPLGPFNSKNWVTQISPWVVTLDALEPFACEVPPQDPAVLPYLQETCRHSYDIQLTASIAPEGASAPSDETLITNTNLKYMYWTFPQMVAHHTVGGCNLQPGDMLGCGTVSGPEEHQRGCLLEITWAGANKLKIKPPGGTEETLERTYLQDGDAVVLRGRCQREGLPPVDFGECRGALLPSK